MCEIVVRKETFCLLTPKALKKLFKLQPRAKNCKMSMNLKYDTWILSSLFDSESSRPVASLKIWGDY